MKNFLLITAFIIVFWGIGIFKAKPLELARIFRVKKVTPKMMAIWLAVVNGISLVFSTVLFFALFKHGTGAAVLISATVFSILLFGASFANSRPEPMRQTKRKKGGRSSRRGSSNAP